jgi:hypothetical protein
MRCSYLMTALIDLLATARISSGVPRPALVIGHPGHELRVYGWLMVARAEVHVPIMSSRFAST